MSDRYSKVYLEYMDRLNAVMRTANWDDLGKLTDAVRVCWKNGNRLFLCGNGGSAGNAMHIANDLAYGIAKGKGPGMRVQALPANVSLLTCLANDEGYGSIFSRQLAVEGQAGDVLVVLSGSGNSLNILEALKQAKEMNIQSFAVLGFTGGKAKWLADVPIHFAIDDMQIAEDLQLILFHMVMQWLYQNGPEDQ